MPAAVKRRRNKDTLAPIVQGQRRGITILNPQPNPDWRTDVKNLYRATLASASADWYEDSDLMMLTMYCTLLDRVLRGARTVPVFEQEYDAENDRYVDVLDEDGKQVPMLDEFGQPERRTLGSINGQALKAVLEMSNELLITEGARRRLRIDLAQPESDEEPREKAIVARQRASVGKVAQPA